MDASIPINRLLHLREVHNPVPLFLLQAAAFWNVWYWLGVRFVTSTDAAWEVLPLIAVIFFSWDVGHTRPRVGSDTLIFAAIFLVLYSVSFDAVPFTLRAILALTSINFFISGWRFGTTFHFGTFALLLLSLPLTESLNFFLGYPMRVLVGESVAMLLDLQGLDVYREGVSLHFGDQLIWIDAPCSGIKMLWFGTFLAAFLSCLFKLNTLRLLAALGLSFLVIVTGNILRASALFYIEAGFIDSPGWMHSAVGVIAFVFTSVAIAVVVRKLSVTKWQR